MILLMYGTNTRQLAWNQWPILFGLLFFSTALSAQGSIVVEIDSLKALLIDEEKPETRVLILNELAFNYISVESDLTRDYAQSALEIASAHRLEKGVAISQKNLGLYYRAIGDLEQANHYFTLSLEGLEKAGDEILSAEVVGYLGHLLFLYGNTTDAIKYMSRSLQTFEKMNYKKGVANQLSYLGIVYFEIEQFEHAFNYFTQALTIHEEMANPDAIAKSMTNIGNVYLAQGDFENAIPYYSDASKIYEITGNLSGMSSQLVSLGVLYLEAGDYQKSSEVLEKSLEYFRKSNNILGEGTALGNLGLAYYASYLKYDDTSFQLLPGSRSFLLDKSIRLFQDAVFLLQQRDELQSLQHFSLILSEASEKANNIEHALKYFKIYTAVKDSLHSIENKTAIERLTTERELALKDKQIELDRLAVAKKRNERLYFGIGMGLLLLTMLFIYRNYSNQKRSNVQLGTLNGQLSHTLQDLQSTQAQLVESEKQKANALLRSRISQDIHDDISSGLTKIAWLAESFMAKTATAAVDVAPLEKINEQARDTVSKLGEIIWSSNPDRDNLESLLTYMRNHIHHYMEDAPMRWRVLFPEEVPEISLSPIVRRNLYLAMKEALHNARKYSQADEIVISFELEDQRYRLEIRDNGRGMDADTLQGGGNGMTNMRRRIQAIGGQLQLVSAPNEGVQLIFEGSIDAA